MSEPDLPFPTLLLDETPPWQWPAVPGGRRVSAPPLAGLPQPCTIETQSGQTLPGHLLEFDPAKRRLSFRTAADAPEASLSFTALRRLTLTEPLQAVPPSPGAPRERLPGAAQERDYHLQQISDAQSAPLTGRTAGYVATPEGMFLYSPSDDEGSVRRVFVPRSAYSRAEFGASAEELAARHWIASPARLLEALHPKQRPPVIPLGQALQALGLLSAAQLERMLKRLDGKTALGEALVHEGLVSKADLQTALAHKMGYPLVDLERFPVDPNALPLLPRRVAIAHRMLPLMLDGSRLVVAVDRPGRVLKLREDPTYAPLEMLPVLALKSQILLAMNRQAGEGWNLNPSERVAFVDTTL